jgi:hypothetical protein
MNPANGHIPFPLILSGPDCAADYLHELDAFIRFALGEQAREYYTIIIDDPVKVAREMAAGLESVRNFRREQADAYYFNWILNIDHQFQQPFEPTHENVAALDLNRDQPLHLLAANLRRAFSAIVAGNVKADGIQRIEQHGPFKIYGEPEIMAALNKLLHSFVEQLRMKVPEKSYTPCYTLEQR